MTTSLVEDFMIATLQSELAMQKATLKTAEDNRQIPGMLVVSKLAAATITEIKRQLVPLLEKQNSKN